MPVRADGSWFPSIFKKQAEVTYSPYRYLLVSGPKYAGKSISVLHALAAHLWEVNHARILFLGKTVSELYEGGLWSHFVDETLQEWVDGDFGMEWIVRDRMRHVTHKQIIRVRNKWGGVGEVVLDSLEHEEKVEKQYKGKEFSLIYMPEATKHEGDTEEEGRQVFSILSDCLRKQNVPIKQRRMILDTNPSDIGKRSWIYKMFYDERVMDPAKIDNPIERQRVKTFQPHLGLIEFKLEDNVTISEEEKEMQRARWAFSNDLYRRYVLGEWIEASEKGFFAEVYRPQWHVIGDLPTPVDENPEVLMPREDCIELHIGWDYGPVNPSVHFIEKIYSPDMKSVFNVIDELCIVGVRTRCSDFVAAVLKKMDYWEQELGTAAAPRKLKWLHRSDRSAFDHGGENNDAKEILIHSNGRICLESSTNQGPKSVMRRARLLQRLLFEDRFFVSSKCPRTQEMLKAIAVKRNGLFSERDSLKHAMDSITYELIEECSEEIDDAAQAKVGRPSDSDVIAVRL